MELSPVFTSSSSSSESPVPSSTGMWMHMPLIGNASWVSFVVLITLDLLSTACNYLQQQNARAGCLPDFQIPDHWDEKEWAGTSYPHSSSLNSENVISARSVLGF